ncbi:MAG TPA: hypothetical protein VL284_18480 [Thermoanaerobaculia bacterium]|nr:hypothetical protein [Thermoanaerobaculia bacterium]
MRAQRLDLAIVIAVALAANFAYLALSSGDYYFPDSFTYLAPARAMLRGAGFTNDKHQPETLRTPGYPLLLAAFGARTLPVIILQHLLNAALAAAIYLFIRWRTANRFTAILAALVFALDPPTIHYANKLLTETLFTVILFIVFAGALQRRNVLALALLLGVLVLIRPIAMFFFVPLGVMLAIWRVPRRRVVAFALVALVLPVGWAIRNKTRTGVFTVSPIGAFNLLSHRAAAALAIEDAGDDFDQDLADEQQGLHDDLKDEEPPNAPPEVRARYESHLAWQVIRQHPLALVELHVRGVFVNFFDSDWDAMDEVTTVSPEVVRWGLGALPAIVFAFAVIGVIALWHSDRAMSILILITVLYFIGISAGSEAESRFRVPVVPQLAIAAAAGVEAVRRGVRR